MTGYMRYWEDISLTQLLVGWIGNLKNACNRWNYDQIYEIVGDISLTQLLVGRIGHPRNACNRWNNDQIYEILGRHLIGPTTYGTHRASQECLIDGIMTRYEILEGNLIDPTTCGTQSRFQECLNRTEKRPDI